MQATESEVNRKRRRRRRPEEMADTFHTANTTLFFSLSRGRETSGFSTKQPALFSLFFSSYLSLSYSLSPQPQTPPACQRQKRQTKLGIEGPCRLSSLQQTDTHNIHNHIKSHSLKRPNLVLLFCPFFLLFLFSLSSRTNTGESRDTTREKPLRTRSRSGHVS